MGLAGLAAFMHEIASCLDLHDRAGWVLDAGLPFRGPDDMICRIQTDDSGTRLRARPQLVLPIAHAEIVGLPVADLLQVQSAVLSELGWVLGPSAEGLLQLAPLAWTDQAHEVARELDMGSAMGRMVVSLLKAKDNGSDGTRRSH